MRMAIFFALLFSCHQETSSSLKHEFSKTHRVANRYFNCQDGSNYPEAVSYLRGLLDYVTSSNPSTFQGDLLAENFCIEVVDSGEFNASASHTGKIIFNSTVLRDAKSEAEVTAILAHELAHISMNHVGEDAYEPFKNDPRYLQAEKDIEDYKIESEQGEKALYEPLSSLVQTNPLPSDEVFSGIGQQLIQDLQNTSYDKNLYERVYYYFDGLFYLEKLTGMQTNMDSVQYAKTLELYERAKQLRQRTEKLKDNLVAVADSIVGSKGGFYSWREQEADEVGYELYLRAGFRADDFFKLFSRSEFSKVSQEECLRRVDEKQIPDRGTASHPDGCWRAWNIGVSEQLAHSKDYAQWLNTNTMLERESSVFANIQALLMQ